MSLRQKLFSPILIFALLLLGGVAFILINNYRAFIDQTRERTAQRQTSLQELFESRALTDRGYLNLINQNQAAVDNVVAGRQGDALDVVNPFTQTDLSFITLYNLNGDIFLQSLKPGAFGKPDDLKATVVQAARNTTPITRVQMHNGQLALLSVQRMDGVSGPAGVTVVGYDLNAAFIAEAAKRLGSDFAILYGSPAVPVASSLPGGAQIPAEYEQTPITFPDVSSDQPFALAVLENNMPAAQQFARDLAVILGAVLLASVVSISGSLAVLNSVSSRVSQTLAVLRRVQAGDLSARVAPPFLADEIGKLQAGVNATGAQLEENFNSLEKRVAERTAELAVARDQALEATRAKSVFFANMSHELRTPLNAVLGFAQVMERDKTLGDRQREHLGIISRSSEHLLGLINDVLEMSKIEAGRITLNTAPFDLRGALLSIRDMLQVRADAKGLQLLFELDSALPPFVNGDESKLRQMLINLLGNAIKFTAEGGVTLRAEYLPADGSRSPRLIFEVEDTGVGIASDQLPKLFQAFSQTESGLRAQEGTGLGLAISRQFAQLMGGDIRVNSTPGQGTIFHAEIEAVPVDALPEAERLVERRVMGLSPQTPGPYRVLIVDDRPDNRRLLSEWLNLPGLHTREASNGQEAITAWTEWTPHLIWMDMRMPVMDGYEATRRIKAELKGQATVIIALTASAFEHERSVILSAGCDDFVRKPVRESVIFDKIGQHLGVQFVYDTSDHASAAAPVATELTPAALTALPADWQIELRDAALMADLDAVKALIGQIRATHPAVADGLQTLVDGFQIDQLQRLVQPI